MVIMVESGGLIRCKSFSDKRKSFFDKNQALFLQIIERVGALGLTHSPGELDKGRYLNVHKDRSKVESDRSIKK